MDMIEVTRLDGSRFYVNCDLIEFIEATPDTILTLTTQKKVVVRETPEQVIARIVAFKRQLGLPPILAAQVVGEE